jgi:PAS domain S-box-containing protein
MHNRHREAIFTTLTAWMQAQADGQALPALPVDNGDPAIAALIAACQALMPEPRVAEEANYHPLYRELLHSFRVDPTLLDWLDAGSLDGLWFWDLEHPEDRWLSPTLLRHLGYDPAEVQHSSSWWQGRIEPADLVMVLEALRNHIEGGKPYDRIVRYRRKDDSVCWVRCRGLALYDAQGRPVRMLGTHTDVTALKETEAVLRHVVGEREAEIQARTAELQIANERMTASERSLRLVLEQAPCAMLVAARDGKITFANLQAERIFAYAPGTMVGLQVEQLIPQGVRSRHTGLREGYHQDPRPRPMMSGQVLHGLRHDGSEIPVEIGLSPVDLPEGPAVLAAITDVSDRVRAEAMIQAHATALGQINERLAASERSLRLVLAQAPCAMLVAARDGKITFANLQAERIFAYAPGSMVGLPVERLIPQAARSRHVGLREGYHQDPRPRPMMSGQVLYGLRSDGSEIPVEIGLSPVDLPEGPAVLAAITDVSDRIRAERMAREHADLQRRLIEGLSQLIWICRPDGRCDYLSQQWIDYTGVPQDAQVGCAWLDYIHPEDRERAASTWQEVVANSGNLEIDIRIRRHDGVYRWFKTRAAPQRDGTGVITGWVGSNTDIQDLIELRELARAADRAKSEFLATMSHEIRTPMNGVLGMLGMLQEMALDPQQMDMVETARRCAESLLNVLNDILDFSKIEAGRLELENADFDLWSEAESVVSVFGQTAHGKGVNLTCIIDPSVPSRVSGDPSRVRQVLLNLVGNAIKFTDSGDVVLRIAPAPDATSPTDLILRVSDSGIGIPPNRIADLFGRFVQVDSSTSRRYGGTGLGLAISRRLVELMGGQIGVESKEGAGSTFWFRICFAPAIESVTVDPCPVAGLAQLRVLVVDSHQHSRDWLASVLTSWKVRHDLVADAPQALGAMYAAMTANDPFRVVIVAAQLPGMDAQTFARTVASDLRLERPLLMLADTVVRTDDITVGSGILACITKPIRRSQLFNLLIAWAGGQKVVSQSTPERIPQRKGRVLVVEDNAVNQQYAVTVLSQCGLQVEVAGNGREALSMLAVAPYNIVLMDVQMPEMDGLEATRQIRAGTIPSIDRSVVIIGLTAHALAEDRARCLSAGMDDYMTKPLTPPALRQGIARWLPEVPLAAEQTVRASGRVNLIDWAELGSRLSGDMVAAEKLVQSFVALSHRLLHEARDALGAGDAAQVQALAHQIAGSAATVCCESVRRLAAGIKQAGDADPGALGTLLAQLEDAIRQIGDGRMS